MGEEMVHEKTKKSKYWNFVILAFIIVVVLGACAAGYFWFQEKEKQDAAGLIVQKQTMQDIFYNVQGDVKSFQETVDLYATGDVTAMLTGGGKGDFKDVLKGRRTMATGEIDMLIGLLAPGYKDMKNELNLLSIAIYDLADAVEHATLSPDYADDYVEKKEKLKVVMKAVEDKYKELLAEDNTEW